MNCLDRYSKSVRKKTEKLLKRLFAYPDLKTALDNQMWLKIQIENMSGKNIEDVTIQDLKEHQFGCYYYAKYRTVKRITDIYLDTTTLGFHSNELEEYKNGY